MKRGEFARLCGVSTPTVTNGARNDLEPAVSGQFIDADHESAKKWRRKQVRARLKSRKKFPLMRNLALIEGVVSARRFEKMFSVPLAAAQAAADDIEFYDELPREHGDSGPKPGARAAKRAARTAAMPDNAEIFMDMTLRQLVRLGGGDIGVVGLTVKGLKEVADLEKVVTDNQKKRGELVPIAPIRDHFFPAIDKGFTQLQTDGATRMSRQVVGLLLSELDQRAQKKLSGRREELEQVAFREIVDTQASIIRVVKDQMLRVIQTAEGAKK